MNSKESSSTSVRIAIAWARFNPEVTERMLTGCRQALLDVGLDADRIEVFPVPGAWELPLACRDLAASGRYDGVIALGAVVRGETAHFDFISAACAQGLQQVQLESGVPVGFGVLTPENRSQAIERADPTRKNKGREAARAVLDMIALKRQIET